MKINEIRKKLEENNHLIHCITNPISIRECANVIISSGARPMMAQHPDEVETITKSAGALLLNLGNLTREREESMLLSSVCAKEYDIPAVLDLCGIAALKNRHELALSIIEKASPKIIKGNYSEIKALYDETYKGSGVDSDKSLTEKETGEIATSLALKYNATVLASGKKDIISDGTALYYCENGTPQMAKITGTGCMQGALCAAFLSVADGMDAALWASVMFAVCGELAETDLGNGSFAVRLLDSLSVIESDEIEKRARLIKVMNQ